MGSSACLQFGVTDLLVGLALLGLAALLVVLVPAGPVLGLAVLGTLGLALGVMLRGRRHPEPVLLRPVAHDLVVKSLPDPVLVLDLERRLVDCNPAASARFGLRPAGALGRPVAEVLRNWPGVSKALEELRCNTDITETRPDREPLVFEASVTPLEFEPAEVAGWVVVLRDVTAQRRIETELRSSRDWLKERVHHSTGELLVANLSLRKEIKERVRTESENENLVQQLNHAQKLESVGRLVGCVAHDFNNVLTAIFGNVAVARRELEASGLEAQALSDIERAAESAAALTRQLLAFSRKQTPERRILDLNQIVDAVNRLLSHLMGKHIEVKTQLWAEPLVVEVDPSQIEQVLVNLAVNARDAMPEGGLLTLETRELRLDPSGEACQKDQDGVPIARLTVRDTGCGMAPEVLEQAFEPFFTTKPPGEGTGLGLATVQGAIAQNGGKLHVTSSVGRGTEFRIDLPRLERAAQAPKAS